MTRTSGC